MFCFFKTNSVIHCLLGFKISLNAMQRCGASQNIGNTLLFFITNYIQNVIKSKPTIFCRDFLKGVIWISFSDEEP